MITLPSHADSDFVAHEWGTFTSIQGSDGEPLLWNGVDTVDLPAFVYNWSRPGLGRIAAGPFGIFSKAGYPALQRMETPVIYFYSETPRRVSVNVNFPQGFLTEWYPQAAIIGPSQRPPHPFLRRMDQWMNQAGIEPGFSFAARLGEKPITNSVIRWKHFEVLPTSDSGAAGARLALDGSANHYFAARETDAGLIRMPSLERTNSEPEFEKFLFYRGVGRFRTPLRATMTGDQITLSNTGTGALKHVFVLEVTRDHAAILPSGDLAESAVSSRNLGFPDAKPVDAGVEDIARRMADALESEGLYRREAEAMVNTWRDVWFAEPGLRVLYVLPRQWTDQILPLDIDPKPHQLVRVMVGRAELISPAMESGVRNCITRYQQADQDIRAEALREFQAIGLGRFAGPAIDLAIRDSTDAGFTQSARALLQAARVAAASERESASGRVAANGG